MLRTHLQVLANEEHQSEDTVILFSMQLASAVSTLTLDFLDYIVVCNNYYCCFVGVI